ncbi:hypothetical protein PsorP6_001338 [Peronosclerospora sorghi]|uniref:Uncharacterized protein n=1 Tax=Peronosclerospora sorghi TaxID=230839 RepID=A0ACC0WX04_9STRA|nr:hypothetical protein PsorP6_001338 [Peronosclerospora sorghi]
MINDREKGFINALEKQVPAAYAAWCCFNIAQNVQTKFGLKAKCLFWRCAYAGGLFGQLERMVEQMEKRMEEQMGNQRGERMDNRGGGRADGEIL